MVSKKQEAIAFYLLVTSILALAVVSITFKYYLPDETFLFEDDHVIYTSETVIYNSSFFDVPQHIFKITVYNVTYTGDPLVTANVKITINENYTETVNGPEDYMVYNTRWNGRIDELVLTDAGLSISFDIVFSALRDSNPIYISLTTLTCILSLYYFYVAAELKKAKKEEITEEVEHKPTK